MLAVLGLLALSWWHVVDLRRNLYRSLVGEVRALEQARSSGYQKEAWRLLRQALELDPRRKAELRQEAVACLGDFAGLEPTHWDLETDLHALALHPNGTLLALGLDDGTVRLRDLVTGQDLASLAGHKASVASLAFATDGKRLLSGDLNGYIQFWEFADNAWTCRRRFILPDFG